MQCPHCNEPCADGATFCEGCGSEIKPVVRAAGAPPVDPKVECPSCHAGPGCIDPATGFCTTCGTRRLPDARNHFVQALSVHTAGVCDIGCQHTENQDFMAIGEAGGATALVLCDGVSNSQNSMEGSKVAATAARDSLLSSIKSSGGGLMAIHESIIKAQGAICKVPFQPVTSNTDLPPAQATIVSALVVGRRVELGWLGDSRAYWCNRKTAIQISDDQSWLNLAIAPKEDGGLGMTKEEAEKDPRAHAITDSLGADNDGKDTGVNPGSRSFNITESGILLLVTDGFWNYIDNDIGILVRLINQLPANTDALTLSQHLVTFARNSGGHDNITVIAMIF